MLLSVAEARGRLLSSFSRLAVESVSLSAAQGRFLAESVVAPFDLPSFTNSSMDGFALRAADIELASSAVPVQLTVIADIPAGNASAVSLEYMQAARIMTGAPLPSGADTVVPVEQTDQRDRASRALPQEVLIYQAQPLGAHVRVQGQDLAAGMQVYAPGHRVRSVDLGLLAMFGLASVPVFRRPRVGVLSTGDELLLPGEPVLPGKIYESNGAMLRALLSELGALPVDLGIARDSLEAVQACFERAVQAEVDLILTSAGVSVGPFDFVRAVLEDAGSLDFWRVNMRPGKPLAFGAYCGVPVVGLPGNPVSSFVGFQVFVAPAVLKLSGAPELALTRHRGKLLEAVSSDGRESYLRAVYVQVDGQVSVRVLGNQGSGNHYSLVVANCLAVIPAEMTFLPAGAEVEIILL